MLFQNASRRVCHSLFLVVFLAAGPEMRATPSQTETLEKTAIEWVRLRTETVKLESEWELQRDLMDATVHSLEQRALAAEVKRDNLLAKTAGDRREIASVESKNQAASDGLEASKLRIKQIQEHLIRLRPALPPRLSSSLELLYRGMTNPDLPIGERMQSTMTILNRCLIFNRSVYSSEEAITLPGESRPHLLAVIYWGLSRAYALDRNAGNAWLGMPGPEGWHWEAHPEATARISRLISIYNDRAEPEFQELPAQLLHAVDLASGK